MTTSVPTVALIHATPAAMAPARAAFADRFPQARVWNLLDDLLIVQVEEAGSLTPALRGRMERLIEHAVSGGADAVLLTCSMYGPVAHDVVGSSSVPVLASDDALFAAVAAHRPGRVTVLGPIQAGVDDTVARLRHHLGTGAAVDGVVVDGAARPRARGPGGARAVGDGRGPRRGAACRRARPRAVLPVPGGAGGRRGRVRARPQPAAPGRRGAARAPGSAGVA